MVDSTRIKNISTKINGAVGKNTSETEEIITLLTMNLEEIRYLLTASRNDCRREDIYKFINANYSNYSTDEIDKFIIKYDLDPLPSYKRKVATLLISIVAAIVLAIFVYFSMATIIISIVFVILLFIPFMLDVYRNVIDSVSQERSPHKLSAEYKNHVTPSPKKITEVKL